MTCFSVFSITMCGRSVHNKCTNVEDLFSLFFFHFVMCWVVFDNKAGGGMICKIVLNVLQARMIPQHELSKFQPGCSSILLAYLWVLPHPLPSIIFWPYSPGWGGGGEGEGA